MSAGVHRSFERDKLHVKDQGAIGTDLCRDLSIPITQVSRDEETPFAACRHKLQTLCPALDDSIQREAGGLAAAD